MVGASPTTVTKVRAGLVARGDVSKMETSTDTKGRRQPTKKKRRATDDYSKKNSLKKAALAPAVPVKVIHDPVAPDEELALLREFAALVINRARSISFDPKDNDEWKVLRGRVKAMLGETS